MRDQFLLFLFFNHHIVCGVSTLITCSVSFSQSVRLKKLFSEFARTFRGTCVVFQFSTALRLHNAHGSFVLFCLSLTRRPDCSVEQDHKMDSHCCFACSQRCI